MTMTQARARTSLQSKKRTKQSLCFFGTASIRQGIRRGHRVEDLYVVCGQAQKCVKWMWNLRTLVKHLVNRETNHKRGRDTRFIRGTLGDLVTLRKSARRKFIDYKIGVVQPGLSKQDIPTEHLAILGATSSFVQCVTNNPLVVFAHA